MDKKQSEIVDDTDLLTDIFTSNENPICFTITDHDDIGTHRHQFIEVVYIISGNILHRLDDQNIQQLTEGDMLLILPPHYHSYKRDNESYCSHRDIIIQSDLFKEACDYLSPNLLKQFQNNQIPMHAKISYDRISQLETTIRKISQATPLINDNKKILLRTFLIQLLQCFLFSNTDKQFNHLPTWFQELLSNFGKIEYLKSGLSKITEHLNYDQKYICHVFKKNMGITMTEHLNNSRLILAVNMLQNTDRSILDISSALGFSSISYFSTIFKNKYGVSPSYLRKNHTNKISY